MLIKAIVVIFMLLILFFLGSGLVHLIKDGGSSRGTVRALSWRIGLSLGLFILLFLAYSFGLIAPHGLGVA